MRAAGVPISGFLTRELRGTVIRVANQRLVLDSLHLIGVGDGRVAVGLAVHGSARGVLHAFSGDAAMALEMTTAGFLVSFALPVTFSSAAGPRAARAQARGPHRA